MRKERWFNYRPLCLIFSMLILGSVFAFYCFYGRPKFGNKAVIISVIALAVLIGTFIFFSIRNKSVKLFLIPFISLIMGASLFCVGVASFNANAKPQPNMISARIYSVEDKLTSFRVYADDVYFDGIKTNCKICVYVQDSSKLFDGLKIGNQINFKPTSFAEVDLFKYETPNSTFFSKDIKYNVGTNMNLITFGEYKLTFAEKVRAKVKQTLQKGLTNENAELAYSALFGDKTLLSSVQKSAFKASGVAHLLAVSGLHVGIIVGILNGIFSLINLIFKRKVIDGWAKVGIISAILLFYIYICDFSSSIVRASIMSIVLLCAPLFKRQYDTLSSISFAGIVCFLVNPMLAFDVSALMSFTCVLGICLLNPTISKFLSKTKMPKVLTESFSISMSTLVMLLFTVAYYFNNINLISLLANVILIPLFTIGFVCAFVIGFIGAIFNFTNFGYLLVPVNYCFDFIKLLVEVLGKLPFANFATTSISYITIPIFFVLILIMSRITTARPEHKMAVFLPVVAILFAVML